MIVYPHYDASQYGIHHELIYETGSEWAALHVVSTGQGEVMICGGPAAAEKPLCVVPSPTDMILAISVPAATRLSARVRGHDPLDVLVSGGV